MSRETKDMYICLKCGAKQIVYPDRKACNKPYECNCGGHSDHCMREWVVKKERV